MVKHIEKRKKNNSLLRLNNIKGSPSLASRVYSSVGEKWGCTDFSMHQRHPAQPSAQIETKFATDLVGAKVMIVEPRGRFYYGISRLQMRRLFISGANSEARCRSGGLEEL